MISYLKGKILRKTPKYATLLVGGVGYKIFGTEKFLTELSSEEEVGVFVHTNVKEDAIDLYAFSSQNELELFELLITLSGVGPKAALGIIAMDRPEAIAAAILREDSDYLTNVSGIGAKTAKKIAVELKDKVAKLGFDISEDAGSLVDAEALDALESLGYSKASAREALKGVSKEAEKVEDKIKEALRILGK